MAKYTSKFTGIEIDERLSKVNEEFTNEEKEKLAALENYDDSEVLAAVEDKVDKVEGKGLSTNDFTNEEKNKLSTLENYDDSGITKSIEDLEENKANKNEVYSKEETDTKITEKVAEIVAGAPEEFNTLKEMSDWLTEHEDSAATMNTAIQANTKAIADNATAIEGNTAEIANNKSDILTAKKTIEINQRSIGMQASKNLFDISAFEKISTYAYNGTILYANNGFTLSATGNDCFTTKYGSDGLHIPVFPNRTYTLSWTADSDIAGTIMIFPNGVQASPNIYAYNNETKKLTFTTKSNIEYITVRFGVKTTGTSITYSNIQIEEGTVATAYEPYKPSVNERLVEVEESVSELTPQVEQNKSDISSIRTDVNDIIPKLSTVSVTSDAENNWYRIFQANQKQTSRSGIIMINRAYSNLAPESYTLFFNFAHSDNVFRLITKKVENHKIDKIRLVYKKTSQQEYPCYIDIHYNGTKLNQINVSMHCEAAALTGTGSTFKNRKFVKSDFSVAEIPEGYTSYEFDLAGGDIFDRLEALEAALAQTTTVSE